MMRQLLIILLHQLCYGSWALRPQSSFSTTTKFVPPRSNRPGNTIRFIQANCTRELFEMEVELSKKFHGILFAKDFLEECRSQGNLGTTVALRIPTSGCGVRSEPKPDGNSELSVRIMLQMDEKLRQSSDIESMVKCILPSNMMSVELADWMDQKKGFRNSRMKLNTYPRVRIWLELDGPDGTGAVEVGQPTTLSVRAVVPGTMGVRVVDCAALDGLDDSSQKLLDERGCPVDDQVMPALTTRYRPAEEGWSKPHQDDLVEKLFSATFPAFKFPDRERLHVSCAVQLCKGTCPKVNCTYISTELVLEKQLPRIEVFNSLVVTAPQIEIGRLRMDRRHNISAEEYPPKINHFHTKGTLCLSISKLAMLFCVLGLIFVIAVIVAICCLLRSRSRSTCTSIRSGSISMFSFSTESHSRFGSKLLIPYPGASLPYGRVH